MPVAAGQRIVEAAMPCFGRFEGYLETEATVGVYSLCR
jgi:hypothetical protein